MWKKRRDGKVEKMVFGCFSHVVKMDEAKLVNRRGQTELTGDCMQERDVNGLLV